MAHYEVYLAHILNSLSIKNDSEMVGYVHGCYCLFLLVSCVRCDDYIKTLKKSINNKINCSLKLRNEQGMPQKGISNTL